MTFAEKENLINWMMKEADKYFEASLHHKDRRQRLNAWVKDRLIMGLARTLVHSENFDKILSGNFDIEVPGGSEKKEVNDGKTI